MASVTGRSFWQPNHRSTLSYNSRTLRHRRSTPLYDNTTGNLTKRILFGEVTGWNLSAHTFTTDVVPSDTQYHHISYYAPIQNNAYITDHPQSVKLTSDDLGNDVLQETKYTYNSYSGTLVTEERLI